MEEFKKKITNIWFYYKVPIIIGILALFILGSTIINKITEPKYNHSIAIVSKYNYPSQENVDKLKTIFEDKYGGTFKVEVYNVSLGETGEDEVLLSKLSLDISNKISEYYFIEDLDTFKKTTASVEFDSVVLVSDVEWLNNLGLDNFYYCVRN